MKIVESNGGPLIAMHMRDLAQWSGIDALSFFKNRSSAETDYDALCQIGMDNPYQVIDVARGDNIDILLIAIPIPTIIVEATEGHIYLAQIETSEDGWSKSELRASDFATPAEWRDPLHVSFQAGTIIFFDSACVLSDLRDSEVLAAHVEEGRYLCEWSRQDWEGKAQMYFIRMVRDM